MISKRRRFFGADGKSGYDEGGAVIGSGKFVFERPSGSSAYVEDDGRVVLSSGFSNSIILNCEVSLAGVYKFTFEHDAGGTDTNSGKYIYLQNASAEGYIACEKINYYECDIFLEAGENKLYLWTDANELGVYNYTVSRLIVSNTIETGASNLKFHRNDGVSTSQTRGLIGETLTYMLRALNGLSDRIDGKGIRGRQTGNYKVYALLRNGGGKGTITIENYNGDRVQVISSHSFSFEQNTLSSNKSNKTSRGVELVNTGHIVSVYQKDSTEEPALYNGAVYLRLYADNCNWIHFGGFVYVYHSNDFPRETESEMKSTSAGEVVRAYGYSETYLGAPLECGLYGDVVLQGNIVDMPIATDGDAGFVVDINGKKGWKLRAPRGWFEGDTIAQIYFKSKDDAEWRVPMTLENDGTLFNNCYCLTLGSADCYDMMLVHFPQRSGGYDENEKIIFTQ